MKYTTDLVKRKHFTITWWPAPGYRWRYSVSNMELGGYDICCIELGHLTITISL